ENTITWQELHENGAANELKPENGQLLQEFEAIKTAILKATSKRGHTLIFLVLLAAGDAAGFYYSLVYYPAFVKQVSGISGGYYLHIAMMGLIFYLALTPLVGYLADQIGVEKVLKAGFLALMFVPTPVLLMVHHNPAAFALLGQLMLVASVSLLEPVLAPFFTLFFPNNIRFLGMQLTNPTTTYSVTLYEGLS
ncbi:MAG: MHS family MFS transporter, partial [Gammaproteobacteria bacterium]|nr:MHS family MFS transporter [Gammaproteobacteria bacterium]